MTISYRQATASDIENLLPLLVDMHSENALSTLDIDKTIAMVEYVINHGLCLLAHDGQELVGALGVCVDSFWYTSDQHIQDRFYYVAPSHRKTRVALTLLKYIREYAKQLNMPLMLGVMTKVDAVRKDRIFQPMTYVGSGWAENFPLL